MPRHSSAPAREQTSAHGGAAPRKRSLLAVLLLAVGLLTVLSNEALSVVLAAPVSRPAPPPVPAPPPTTLEHRFPPPEGCVRVPLDEKSYGAYLRRFPLKPEGSLVHDYRGRVVQWGAELGAVLDVDLIKTRGFDDLQQCADLAMRLWGEYHFERGTADGLSFTLQNGQSLAWRDWRRGVRGRVVGPRHRFTKRAAPDPSYQSFRAYLGYVMTWLGSAGIKVHATEVPEAEVTAGDLYVQNHTGAIGHVSVIMDQCTRGEQTRYLVAESYMPAQEGHVILPAPGEGEGAWFTSAGLQTHLAHFGTGAYRRLP